MNLFSRSLWSVVVGALLISAGCASRYDLDRTRELKELRGTENEMRSVLRQRQYYYSKTELTSVFNLTAMNYCWNKERNDAKSSSMAFEKLKVLADAGAKVDGNQGVYPNPMVYASLCDATDVMDYLLSKGAKLNIEDPVGNTLLHKAVCNKTLTMMKYLHGKGLALDAPGHFGDTPMQAAIKCRNTEAIDYLKQHGVTH